MIITLISWIIILILAVLLGDAFIFFVAPDAYKKTSKIDVCIVCGLLVLDVYAQAFSIIYKVGMVAFGLIALIAAFWGIYRYKAWHWIIRKQNKLAMWKICISILIITYIALWTLKSPTFVDSYLYHAQAIRWIEEYGVVPGLGNLHNRFAYNSAFMPLQALFSFSWKLNYSLHSLNGFVATFFAIYSLITNNFFTKRNSNLSDFFKIVVVIYVYLNHTTISSPSSDLLAMLLVLYMAIKWCECIENEEITQSYSVLCLIAVWAVSIKLSAAIAILLAIYPASVLIREKQYKTIFKYITCGIIIALPWLTRNVIISGYLIYPYAQIDLFSVDWKMPKSLLDYDRKEIVVWGREIKDVSQYNQPITKWIFTWFNGQMLRNKLFIFGGSFSTLVLIILIICNLISVFRKKKWIIWHKPEEWILLGYTLVGLFFWLFSAPLLRYGIVYLMMPIAIFLNIIKENVGDTKFRKTIIFMGVCATSFLYLYKSDDFRLIEPQDYWHMENDEIQWNGFKIYVPISENRLSGYYDFPSSPEIRILNDIVPRGQTLNDGFRTKNSD